MPDKYPFPESEWRGWWDGVAPWAQRRFGPLLRAMTPAEREEFHRDRKDTAARHDLEGDASRFDRFYPDRDQEQADALFARWATRVRARRAA